MSKSELQAAARKAAKDADRLEEVFFYLPLCFFCCCMIGRMFAVA